MPLSTETKNDRKAFREAYSFQTQKILQRVARGETSQEIADRLDVPRTTVTTTRGNYTREAYFPYAYPSKDGEMLGTCKF